MKRPLIGLAISAVLFLLSVGLCGLGAGSNQSAQGTLVAMGLFALGSSILGGITCFVWLLVALIRGK